MNIVTKAQKYDAIVRIWNEHLTDNHGDVWYILCGHPLASDIQDVIKDDITEYISVD